MDSKLLGRKTEKDEIQMLSCGGELKADEYWMNAETSWIRDIARGRRDKLSLNGGRPVCKALKVKVASLNRMRHSIESQWSCLRSSSVRQ